MRPAHGVLAGIGIALAFVAVQFGCQPNSEPIERFGNTMVTEVVKPAVEKATAELAQRSAMLQGQGSLINPGYNMKGFGIVGTGFVWDATIQLEGVSANLAGATQADQGPDLMNESSGASAGGSTANPDDPG